MADPKVQSLISDSLEQAVGHVPGPNEDLYTTGGLASWLVHTGDLVPPWQSRSRDKALVMFVMECNHLAIAVYNAITKLANIPFDIVPRDVSNAAHMDEAIERTYLYQTTPGFGSGWQTEYSKFLFDFLTTDNGAFMELIGDGPSDGPIVGRVTSMRHLDSNRCGRTANPVYPILYMDDTGRLYKMHYTRVMYASQMPSARKEMNGVGFCAASRTITIAQNLLDISNYKMQRLGSRPHNQLLIGKGVTGNEIMLALRRAEEEMSAKGFTRYARTVAIGSKNVNIGIERVDLAHMDPFDEEISINLGMFAIAAGLGMDADELWPVSGRSGGGSRGDANLRRMRSRGRLPAQVTSELTQQFQYKVLPPHLTIRFDFRDDEEDQQQALVKDIRGRNRERDLVSGAADVRTVRLQMLDNSDLTPEQFEMMELNDGRLPNGNPLAMLFFDKSDPVFQRHLSFGSVNPLDVKSNDGETMLSDLSGRKQVLLTEWAQTSSGSKAQRLRQAWHAIDWLYDQYMTEMGLLMPYVPTASRRERIDRRTNEPVGVSAEQENV